MRIEIDSLSVSYGGPDVLDGISLAVSPSEIVSVIGANGTGKSTLLRAVAKLQKFKRGKIMLDGRDIHSYSRRELALKMSFLPQSRYLPEDMTVHDLVCCGRFPHRFSTPGKLNSKGEDPVELAISLTSLGDLRMRKVSTLSGGERQRAWIALCIAQEPDLMILDEPTTFLDVKCQFDVMDLIAKMNRELGTTVLMALHDLNHVAHYSHRIIALRGGKIFIDGTASEVIREDVLHEVFGIRSRIIYDNGIPYFIPRCSVSAGSEERRYSVKHVGVGAETLEECQVMAPNEPRKRNTKGKPVK